LIVSSNHHQIGVRAADHESDNDQIIRILVLAFHCLLRDEKSNKREQRVVVAGVVPLKRPK
jgi:hypothetical protein